MMPIQHEHVYFVKCAIVIIEAVHYVSGLAIAGKYLLCAMVTATFLNFSYS